MKTLSSFSQFKNSVCFSSGVKPQASFDQLYRFVLIITTHPTERLNQLETVAADLSNVQRLSAPGGFYDAKGLYTGYNASESAAISNEFATASYRFGHSLVSNRVDKRSSGGDKQRSSTTTHLKLTELFDQVDRVLFDEDGIDGLLAGSAHQASESFDEQVVDALQHRLERSPNSSLPTGLDLFAISVQRGRDHGLQVKLIFKPM